MRRTPDLGLVSAQPTLWKAGARVYALWHGADSGTGTNSRPGIFFLFRAISLRIGNTVRCQCEAAVRTINSFPASSFPQADCPFLSRISSTCDMGDSDSPSSHFQKLFESALQDYERQTGTKLSEHPLADQLERCKSVESVIAVIIQGQARRLGAFGGFRRRSDGKVTNSLQRAVSVLYPLSTGAVLDTAIRTVCPKY